MAESQYINQWQISIEETTLLKFVSRENRRFHLVHHNWIIWSLVNQVQRWWSRCRIFILHDRYYSIRDIYVQNLSETT